MTEDKERKSQGTAWNRRRVGTEQESRVQEYLQTQGYEIVARNFFTKHGEIDIIAKKEGYLIFIEVKYRADERFGAPGAAEAPKDEVENKFCPYCGTPLSGDFEYCNKCGKKLP